MPRSGPTTLALPPFNGAIRRLTLIYVSIFFLDAVLNLVLPGRVYLPLVAHLSLIPAFVARGEVWQLFTYAFLPVGILNSLFAVLTLWFFGWMLEERFGSRWLYELCLTSSVGAAVLATFVSFTHVVGLTPSTAGIGPYAAIYGVMVAVAMRFGDQEFLLLFVVRVRAKYLVAILILVDLAMLLKSADEFDALLHVSGALCGFFYLRFAPRRGLAQGLTERWFALRNEYYRSKRRRAAKKFEVYMRKQNRDVRFDENGRYIEPDERPGQSPEQRDPNDRRWMN